MGAAMSTKDYPVTPDGRYFVVGERLWRCTDPGLPASVRDEWTRRLMRARSAVRHARTDADVRAARDAVHEAKVALGERGPVWWDDGAEAVDRRHPKNTAYADWWASLAPPGEPDA